MKFQLLAATALTTTISFLVPVAAFAQAAWDGPYVGVTAGIIHMDDDLTFENYTGTATGPDAIELSATGALLGVTIGHNWDMGGVVLGVEADASFSTASASASGAEPSDVSFDADAELESLLTLRGRVGFTAGNALFYGTAGLAGGSASYNVLLEDDFPNVPAVAASDSGFVSGIVAGAGVEYALTDNLSIKTEGLFYNLAPLSGPGDTGKGGFDSEYSPSGVTLRAGVNYSF